ncbi:hypothetical protein ACGFZA_32945 [Streptomyces sp. NPDC048211]|uniref:hypothetical protein n=1 Tax=Streptomyces sp. NPDC048211 TaxID=3365516 RepID=UPI00371BBAEE
MAAEEIDQDVVRAAAQTVVIEEVRAYVERIRSQGPIDLADTGRLVGHLMSAEVLLMNVAEAFTPAN